MSFDSRHQIVDVMTNSLEHRGPDARGIWVDENLEIALGHQRLAILDLSAAGSQPMISHNESLVLVFNGEIYNHLDLRLKLEAETGPISWRGLSDTETLLESISNWGIDKTLLLSQGMFAFAVWNQNDGSLILARDRFGEKPLYYGWQQHSLIFGSDLSAHKLHPDFKNQVDRSALVDLLRFNSIPAPRSIFSGIQKLRPGHYISFSYENLKSEKKPEEIEYWSPNQSRLSGKSALRETSLQEDVVETKSQIADAVRRQMISDVPVGAFLSGGIDSSVIVSQMAEQSSSTVQTFTVGFKDRPFDESGAAESTSKILGTEHSTLLISPMDVLRTVESVAHIYSEPFGDSSQIPTYLVSKLASQSVKVALSGDGGDEVFAGYNRYISGSKLWKATQQLPLAVKQLISGGIGFLSPQSWDKVQNIIRPVLPTAAQSNGIGDLLYKAKKAITCERPEDFYLSLISDNPEAQDYVIGAPIVQYETIIIDTFSGIDDFCESMMIADAQGYLPTDILAKVDRAAMANSLETRTPFLDPQLYEFSWTLPLDRKIQNGKTKWVLRQILNEYFPETYFEKAKQGFGIPIDEWLRSDLRTWAEELLSPTKIRKEGFLNADLVESIWKRHLSGKENFQHQLWSILMFELWLDAQNLPPS